MKSPLTDNELRRRSGKESGIYVFVPGCAAFMPLDPHTVSCIIATLLRQGEDAVAERFRASFPDPTPCVPPLDAGTHGAGPDKTKKMTDEQIEEHLNAQVGEGPYRVHVSESAVSDQFDHTVKGPGLVNEPWTASEQAAVDRARQYNNVWRAAHAPQAQGNPDEHR